MKLPNTVLIFGSKEHEFPKDKILLKNYKIQIVPGNRHFNGNAKVLADAIDANL